MDPNHTTIETVPNTKDLSYTEIFAYYVGLTEKRQQTQPPTEGEHSKPSYTLLDDLRIILVSNTFDEVKNKDYKQFELKVPGRSYQSIRDRFLHFLRHLTREDFDRIVKHLQSQGLTGYLLFSTGQHKKLINIVTMDPKTQAMQIERRRFDEEYPSQKKVRLNQHENIDQNELEIIEDKKSRKVLQQDPTFPKNEYDRFALEDLDEVLTIIAQWKRAPKAVIVEKLHQLSGNLTDLDEYLSTMSEQNCWLEEEDMLLAQAQSKHSPEIRLLIRTKTLERVKRRIKYLGYQLRFEFD